MELPPDIEFSRVFTEGDVKAFASLSEDDNPLHLDADYAAGTSFKKPVVHGVLLLGMFSRIFGNEYPGRGSIYLSQTAEFLRPAYLNQNIKAKVSLQEYDSHRRIGTFLTQCFNEAGKKILSGKAEVLFPEGFFPEDGTAGSEDRKTPFLRRNG
jgi:3-hydroxybutyryl-CoA dehydratase